MQKTCAGLLAISLSAPLHVSQSFVLNKQYHQSLYMSLTAHSMWMFRFSDESIKNSHCNHLRVPCLLDPKRNISIRVHTSRFVSFVAKYSMTTSLFTTRLQFFLRLRLARPFKFTKNVKKYNSNVWEPQNTFNILLEI